MKLALWGYGNHGRDMELILTECWADRYQITAVFDQRFAEQGPSDILGLPVSDPDTAAAMYRDGVYEGMLITVFNADECKRIERQLNERGIPVAHLDCANRRRAPESFAQWEKPIVLPQKGYTRFCFRDQYLQLTRRHRIPFVFDKEGTINNAFWQPYQITGTPYMALYAPRTDKPCVELKGDWCLATGVFSDNYWHFTYEALDHVWAMEKSGYQGRYLMTKSTFAPILCDLIGVDPARVSWLEDLEIDTNYQIERLYYPVLKGDAFTLSAPVLADMAEAVRGKLLPDEREYPERIYVKRIGIRKLFLPQSWLDEHGFVTIIPEEHSVEEQIRYFMHAKIILSPHGANSTNSLYMTPGSVLIETFPNCYVHPCCLETCAQRGIHYLMVSEVSYMAASHASYPGTDYSLKTVQLDLALHTAEALTDK